MSKTLPFRYLEPTFYSGLLDDPVLYLKVRPMGRALLFDCGQIHHLAKRVLKSIDAVFISHAHMDHFMGIDTLTRNVHVAPRTVEIYGPPGIAAKLEHKLAGYDWNLAEQNWCSFRVTEVSPEGIDTYTLPGPEGFPCRFEGRSERDGAVIYSNRWLNVSAVSCDHKIPSLALRLDERPSFAVDPARIEAERLVEGEWLRELNRQFCDGRLGHTPLDVLRKTDGRPEAVRVDDPADLYRRIARPHTPASLGYISDVGFTAENCARLVPFLKGVDLLLIECTFLREDRDKARRSSHLCTSDVNELVRQIGSRFVLPMHLSKSYLGHTFRLYRELDPPAGVQVIRLPTHIAPRPLLPSEVERVVDAIQDASSPD